MKRLQRLKTLSGILATALFATAALSLAAAPGAQAAQSPKLVISGDFPDPDVLQVGSTYYAYSTNSNAGNIPFATSSSPYGPWSMQGNALPKRPAWAVQSGGWMWAPDVTELKDGSFLMYFAAKSISPGRHCIGAATSASPRGPFVSTAAAPLFCQYSEGGSIDPASFVDTDGKRYLLYKTDGVTTNLPTRLYLQQVADDGVTLIGSRSLLLSSGAASEHGNIEAPTLVKRDSKYVLLYSGGIYTYDGGNSSYNISYGISSSIRGPYTKSSQSLMTTQSNGRAVVGPGGQDVVTSAQGDVLMLHGWTNSGAARSMFATPISWTNGYPVLPTAVGASAASVKSAGDLVAADSDGILWNYPARGDGQFAGRVQIGQGWTGVRSIKVIDWNADGVLDLVAQWNNGKVNVYLGSSGGGFSTGPVLSAQGWADVQLTIGYWIKGSKYPQLLSKESSGIMRLWHNTNGTALSDPTQIGQGWGSLNTTMVDFDGDGNQDLLAQSSDGAMRLYRSNGAGAFISETRTVIGSGWQNMTSVSLRSGFQGINSIGVTARNQTGEIYYYPIQQNRRWGAPQLIGPGWGNYLIAGGENINPTS
ncbi:family 43 glycosylhydrolase [Psychromicrobium lacuslunae]|uniref:family 43 glycosylhydrolase n=1 Tax=Psychromicrobium lacuslunae TaxID=1618207 RepID=UPI000698A892|nr:family 43 glycosylhydrolase [Psychromicrobium lacuslunae]